MYYSELAEWHCKNFLRFNFIFGFDSVYVIQCWSARVCARREYGIFQAYRFFLFTFVESLAVAVVVVVAVAERRSSTLYSAFTSPLHSHTCARCREGEWTPKCDMKIADQESTIYCAHLNSYGRLHATHARHDINMTEFTRTIFIYTSRKLIIVIRDQTKCICKFVETQREQHCTAAKCESRTMNFFCEWRTFFGLLNASAILRYRQEMEFATFAQFIDSNGCD